MAPLRVLHSRLWLGAIAAFCASGLLALWFSSRHWYYASSPITGILALGPFILPLALWPFLVYRSRPAQNRDAFTSLVALVPALTIVVAQALLAATGPSLQRAQELAATGHPREAMLEAKASAELGIDADRAKVFHDALLLKEVENNVNPSTVWPELAAATFLTEGSRHEAERHALGVTEHRPQTRCCSPVNTPQSCPSSAASRCHSELRLRFRNERRERRASWLRRNGPRLATRLLWQIG